MSHSTELPTVVYSPESKIRSPRQLIRQMFQDLGRSRELAWRLFVRDLSAQYRQSFLGIFWAFIPPIVTSLVFILLQSRRIFNFDKTDIPYPVYVLVGTILWQLFAESLSAPLKTVTNAKAILSKINIPYESLILSSFFSLLFSLLMKLVVLLAIFLIFKIKLSWMTLLSPLVFILLILLGLCIGLFLTPWGMLYTDISSSLPIVTQLWFFITPVIYPVPTTYPLSLIAVLNPVTPLLVGARDLAIRGLLVNPAPFLIISSLIPIALFITWVIFRLSIPIIIERISS